MGSRDFLCGLGVVMALAVSPVWSTAQDAPGTGSSAGEGVSRGDTAAVRAQAPMRPRSPQPTVPAPPALREAPRPVPLAPPTGAAGAARASKDGARAFRPADHTAHGHAHPAGTRDPGRGHFGGDGGGALRRRPVPGSPRRDVRPVGAVADRAFGIRPGRYPADDRRPGTRSLDPPSVPADSPTAAPEPEAGLGARPFGPWLEGLGEPVPSPPGPRLLHVRLLLERQRRST